ncbi:MAG: nicotinate phosphoribosyltransferase, partial [Longimicrobiales bacterium]|nr:nicotinate phosphoribosyltransferase [Longimicrobiales bacterium]
GTDAGLKAARAFHVAGVSATSNVLAGQVYGVPVTGTMAHSYIQSHDQEKQAFRAFMELYPETVLLVDTYDTLDGVRAVAELAEELGTEFTARGIRLDSGDLGELAEKSRKILDDAGLEDVEIFASGGLDEHEIAELLTDGAPIDGFGVGTGMGVSRDAPALDIAYKLTSYGGEGRLKLSPGKKILPGRKQIYRIEEGGVAIRDVLARADSGSGGVPEGRPLLKKVMEKGSRTSEGGARSDRRARLEEARERARAEIDRLPERIRSIDDADPPYPVEVSDELREYQERVIEEVDPEHAGEGSEP